MITVLQFISTHQDSVGFIAAVFVYVGVLLLCYCRRPAAEVYVDNNSDCRRGRDYQLWSTEDVCRFIRSLQVNGEKLNVVSRGPEVHFQSSVCFLWSLITTQSDASACLNSQVWIWGACFYLAQAVPGNCLYYFAGVSIAASLSHMMTLSLAECNRKRLSSAGLVSGHGSTLWPSLVADYMGIYPELLVT